MELNSCHCSDSSRAERRGSERDSERRSAGTERASERKGERERGRAKRGETREAGRSRSGHGVQVTAARSHVSLSTAQPGTPRALSRRRDQGCWTGARCLVLSQVSVSPGNSGGELATGSLFSGSFSKRRKQKFLPTGSFSFSHFWRPVRLGRESPQSCQATPAGLLVFLRCPFFLQPVGPGGALAACGGGRARAGEGPRDAPTF